MKKILAILLAAIAGQTAHASLEKKPSTPDSNATVWTRAGIEIMRQTFSPDAETSICIISPFDVGKGRGALIIYFNDKRIASIFSRPALADHSFSVDDFTKDGIPDFIQIKKQKTDELIEAYTIINGIVEPLPDELLKKGRPEFYYDEEIIAYLKNKQS